MNRPHFANKAENCTGMQAFALDFDKGISSAEIFLRAERVGIQISFAYHTLSSFEAHEKFGIVFIYPSMIENPFIIKLMISMLYRIFPEADPACKNIDRFDQLFLYYEMKGIKLKKNTFKKNLELLTPNGKYNLLAQLLSDHPHIPIRFALFAGKDKTSTMYSVKEFGDMCILLALDKINDYGDTLNVPQADERNRKTERKEVMLFDEKAFKEAVLNAFQHNLWTSGTAPMFTAFQDRIEITSIGTMPPKQTKEGFYAGVSIPVNDKLTEILVQLHISEKSGRGVPRIVGAYGEQAFNFRDNSITVTIPFNRLDLSETLRNTPHDSDVTPHDTPHDGGITPMIPLMRVILPPP